MGNDQQLRAAILRANRRPGLDRIELTSSIVLRSDRRGRGPRSGDLDVTDDLVVTGGGTRRGTGHAIKAKRGDRIFDVKRRATLSLSGIKLVGGRAPAGQGGGAVRSTGATVRVEAAVVRRNQARGRSASGGAFLNRGGRLTIVDSTLSTNTAARAGGAISTRGGRTVLTDSLVVHGRAASGGGLHVDPAGRLVLRSSTIAKSRATAAAGSGGAVFNDAGQVRATDSVLTDNEAARAGGAIESAGGSLDLTEVTVRFNKATAAPGNGGGVHVGEAGVATVSGGAVRNNAAASEGGGLWVSSGGTLMVDGVQVSENNAAGDSDDEGGGGIYSDGGAVTVVDSQLSGNSATGAAGSGGALLDRGGDLSVERTIVKNNFAARAGGGIATSSSAVTLADVTLDSNRTVASPGHGGGLYAGGATTVAYTLGTVSANRATGQGGGLWCGGESTLTARLITFQGNAAGTDTAQRGADVFHAAGPSAGGTCTVNGADVPLGTGLESAPADPGLPDSTVDNEADLRAAVRRSNAQPGTDTIVLAADIALGPGTDTDPDDDTDEGPLQGDLDVTDSLVVHGDGHTIDGQGLDRIFDVTGGAALDLSDIGLVDGAPAVGEDGGAVRATDASVRVADAVVSGNWVVGVFGYGVSGGAISSSGGTLTIERSTLSDNVSGEFGGAVSVSDGGTLDVRRSTLSGNQAAFGGALWSSEGSRTTIASSSVVDNVASTVAGSGGGGIAIDTGDLDVAGTEILRNTADNLGESGGGIFGTDATVTVMSSTVSDNSTSGFGGGIAVQGVEGSLTVRGSTTISGNRATGYVAGRFTSLGVGGGVYLLDATGRIDDTTIADNSAYEQGGGVVLSGAYGSLVLDDVDLDANRVTAVGGDGGGLHLTGPAQVTYTGGTVSNNQADDEGGGLWCSSSGLLTATGIRFDANTAPLGADAFREAGDANGRCSINGTALPAGSGTP